MSKVLVEGFRLAPQQERVWLLHQKDKSRAYRAQSAIRIDGEIDARLLRRAVEEVVQRHEILRTSFRATRSRGLLVNHGPMSGLVNDLDRIGLREAGPCL